MQSGTSLWWTAHLPTDLSVAPRTFCRHWHIGSAVFLQWAKGHTYAWPHCQVLPIRSTFQRSTLHIVIVILRLFPAVGKNLSNKCRTVGHHFCVGIGVVMLKEQLDILGHYLLTIIIEWDGRECMWGGHSGRTPLEWVTGSSHFMCLGVCKSPAIL